MTDRTTPEQAADFCLAVCGKIYQNIQGGYDQSYVDQGLQGLAEWIRGDREMSEMLTLYAAGRLMCEHCAAGRPVNRYDNADDDLDGCWYHILDDDGKVALCDARPIQDEIRRRGQELMEQEREALPPQVEMAAPNLAPPPERVCPRCGNDSRFSNRYNIAEVEATCDACGHLFLKEVPDDLETGDREPVPDNPDDPGDQPAVVDVPEEEADAEPVV